MLEQLYKENIEMEHLSLQIITKQARSLFNIHECCEKKCGKHTKQIQVRIVQSGRAACGFIEFLSS